MDGFCSKIKKVNSTQKTKLLIGIVMLLSLTIVPVTINHIVFTFSGSLSLLIPKGWINVHLIPHTHDDVGWLKTPEGYYEKYVRNILSNVVYELQKNALRKFVYVETYFFWKWWNEQPEFNRNIVRNLISKKQLEIIGGGFCMSDEAVTYYQSFIDQSTWGFRFLNDTFGPGVSPTVAWQIDTFGHSRGIASLLAQMGFDSLFFARLDLGDHIYRKKKKLMEFVWFGKNNLRESSSIFTSILYDHYSAPNGFDFETQLSDTKIDFQAFSAYIRKHAKCFKTNNVLVPMGDDFRFINAKKYFEKIDDLIEFFNSNNHFKINVFYSTPSLYIRHLQRTNLIWPTKQGDFLPYAAEKFAFWTGYFTSRPTLKYFSRISNNFLQISKQLLVFANTGMKFSDDLTSLREVVAILQHHDAITGTAQQHVTNHYSKLLFEGINKCSNPVDESLRKLSLLNDSPYRGIYETCLLLNISSCKISENSPRFVVTVYNSLSTKINYYVRIPVTRRNYVVLTSDGTEIETQLVAIPRSVRNIPGRSSNAKSELVFRAVDVPPMGFKSYFISEDVRIKETRKGARTFNSKNLKVIFNPRTQFLSGFHTETINISVCQSIKYYKSMPDWSGAYLFGPKSGDSYYLDKGVVTKLLNNGYLVKEYEQKFSEWASQIIRIYQDEDFVEFEWLIGPIPVGDLIGKEIISVYSSDIDSGEVFYTDVNGMDMEERVRDYREWTGKWNFKSVSGNYYPVTSAISVKDIKSQMFLVVDRSQGGSSLRSGEIELMIHRRLCYDDGRGVSEPLNETAFGTGLVVRGRHWLLFGKNDFRLNQKAKLFAQMRHSEPWLFFLDATPLSFDEWQSYFVTEFSGLNEEVPRNVRILTLEPWREDTILLRLENVFEENQMPPVTVCLKGFFKDFEVLEVRETTLGADRWLSETNRLKWNNYKNFFSYKKKSEENIDDRFTIILKPQEIRTFIVKIKVRH